MKKWGPLVILAAAQFVMVLDQAVMNVSISQLVIDFDTTVTTIQAVITLYSLMMAMLMLTGGKIGDIIGRRRAFAIGLVIYGCGSALTAASQTVPQLAFGWSILEGIGAALVLPALAALIAGNYQGRDRAAAYAVIGGVAGAGIAVGPILGGWATTELSWRVVFLGEVVLVLLILAGLRMLTDAPGPEKKPKLDFLGAVLSASGLGLIVFAMLQASIWGWIQPKDSPVEPFGFALTPFVIAAGGVVLWLFVKWQHRREASGTDPLVHVGLFRITPLRAGLQAMLAQNLILMGVFFTIPLYLQLVLGLRRPRHRHQDAAGLGGDVPRLGGGLPPGAEVLDRARSCAAACRSSSWRRCCCSGPSSRRCAVPGSPSPWRCSGWAWASSPRRSATWCSRRSTPRAAARPAASSTRRSSSARPWAWPSSGPSCSRASPPPSSTRSRATHASPTRSSRRPPSPCRAG